MTAAAPPTRVRWTVCALLFFATTVNYFDRQLFSLLVPYFENDLRLGPTDLALINVGFLFAYGFGMVFVGRFIDRVGTKRGLGTTFVLWNVASAAHALIGSLGGFVAIRFLLGLGEAGNFPASVKTVAEWFPRHERALATGWFNAGSNVGAILAPLLAIALAEAAGWRACFLVLGGVGTVWIFFWLRLYHRPDEHPRVSPEELAYIRGDAPESLAPVSYAELFGMRPVYGVALAKFFSDAPWWFYLTWLPKFLSDEFHLTPTFMALALPVVYVVSDFGAVGGGWLSSRLLERGRSVGAARKTAMLVCALGAVPVACVGRLVETPTVLGIPSVYPTILVLSIAAAAHQGWSANVYTLVSDTVPRGAVAMTVGVITAFGVVGAAVFQFVVGRSVAVGGSYAFPFLLAGGLYLVALLALHLVLPRVEPTVPRRRVSPFLVGGLAALLVASLAGLQIALNRPPYASLDAYVRKRGEEKHAALTAGPAARVGWMQARWFVLRPSNGAPKAELVKIDDQGRPVVEPKGAKAKEYAGPSAAQIDALTRTPETMNPNPHWDLVALGEVMLRLDPGDGRIATTRSFRAWEGGGEYNVARGLRRAFGKRTAIVTALADNPVGRLVEDLMLQGGVDLRHLRWAGYDGVGREARNGLNFTERGFGVRGAIGCSDRGHTAVSGLKAGDVDWENIFGGEGARWFHTGGIFAALSETTPEVAAEAMRAARAHGVKVSYDLNYRPSLWKSVGGQAKAQAVNRALAPYVDVMIGNEEDFSAALGFEIEGADEDHAELDAASYARMIDRVVAEFPNVSAVATTLRVARTATRNDWGAILWTEGRIVEATPRPDLEIYDRVGGGDSFASGLIYGMLEGKDPRWCVECGAAHGALAMTTPGDTSMATRPEVLRTMKGGTARVDR